MEEIDVLPKDMVEKSLSDREIVLPYEDALKALDLYIKAGWAFLGWEGWGKHVDGKVGHCDYQGTVSIERKDKESCNDYAKRSYDLVKKTIQDDYKDWQNSPYAKEYELYFCITPVSE